MTTNSPAKLTDGMRFALSFFTCVVFTAAAMVFSQAFLVPLFVYASCYKLLIIEKKYLYGIGILVILLFFSFIVRYGIQDDFVYNKRTDKLSPGKMVMLWKYSDMIVVPNDINESFQHSSYISFGSSGAMLSLAYTAKITTLSSANSLVKLIKMYPPEKLGPVYLPYSPKIAIRKEIDKLIKECLAGNVRSINERSINGKFAPIDVLLEKQTYESYAKTMLHVQGIDVDIEITNAHIDIPLAIYD